MVACLQPGSGWSILIWWLGKCIYVGCEHFLNDWQSEHRVFFWGVGGGGKVKHILFYCTEISNFYFTKSCRFFSPLLFSISFNFKTWILWVTFFSFLFLLVFLPFRALASSAPIWQFNDLVPCDVFMKIVTTDFSQSGPNCSESIRRSWDAINRLAKKGKL